MQNALQIKTVLYITTQFTGTWRYFSWVAYPNIWYYRIQNQILKTLDEKYSENCSVKFYPSDVCLNPNIEWAKSSLKVQIKRENLSDILCKNNFDLIVTEASATTLLEALCTKSQILVFIPKDFIKLTVKAKKLLAKRVFFAENEKDYYQMLEGLICSPNAYKFKEINDDFLIEYGLGHIQAKPLSLTKQALYNILN
jgi:hypothetical protein